MSKSSSASNSDQHASRAAVKQQASAVGDELKELAEVARQAVREELAALRGRGEDMTSAAKHQFDEAERALVERVRTRPLSSLACAAGIGLLIGVFLRR